MTQTYGNQLLPKQRVLQCIHCPIITKVLGFFCMLLIIQQSGQVVDWRVVKSLCIALVFREIFLKSCVMSTLSNIENITMLRFQSLFCKGSTELFSSDIKRLKVKDYKPHIIAKFRFSRFCIAQDDLDGYPLDSFNFGNLFQC